MLACKESNQEITSDATSGSSEEVMNHPSMVINEEDGDDILVTGINYNRGTTTQTRPSKTESVGPNEPAQQGSTQSRRFDGAVVVDQQPQQAAIGKGQPTAFSTQQGECGALAEEHFWISNSNLNAKQGKLAILCVSTGTRDDPNYIENCTVMKKMKECLEHKLGYATCCIGKDYLNVTTSEMESLIAQLRNLNLPKHFTRVIFYFFGHATEKKLKLADGAINKKEVIESVHSISLSENVFKILMFDCCRMNGNIVDCEVGHSHYTNTIIINATEINTEAFYYVKNGCGFMTEKFVELAPKMNCSLSDLLHEIRKKIFAIVKEEKLALQMLVYEDKLMGQCYLLAESQGESRVIPVAVRCSAAVLLTNIHFQFDPRLESQIEGFEAQVFIGSEFVISASALPCHRMATVKGLKPDTSYTTHIVVKYNDGAESKSEVCKFHTPARECPSEIKVKQRYDGSSACCILWNYVTDTTDLNGFHLKVQTAGRVLDSIECDVPNFRSGSVVRGFVPGEQYTVTVTALYCDGQNKESTIEYNHPCRHCPEHFEISQSLPGSKKARLSWRYSAKQFDDLQRFVIQLVNDDNIEQHSVAISQNPMHHDIENLLPSTKYTIKLIAEFRDGYNTPETTLEHINCVRPQFDVANVTQTTADIVVTQPADLDEGEAGKLQVIGMKYFVWENGGGEDGNQNSDERRKYRDFKTPYRNDSGSQQPKRRICKLKAGKKYSLMMQVKYGENSNVESGPYHFDTLHYTECQKAGCCALFIFSLLLGVPFLLLALFLCGVYAPYQLELPRQEVCSTYYSLAIDDVQCGSANALDFGTMKVRGDPQDYDLLSGNVHAWLTPKDNLTFYSQQYPPLVLSDSTNKQERILLTGWQRYTWTGSIIAGYCCITNNDVMEKTANLYIFTSDTDAEWFMNSSRTTHSIFSDSITIPPGHLECFRKWGANKPFITSLNSYHYIGVDIPSKSNFTYNVTVLKKFVNGSDYGSPRYFNHANSTTFSLPSSSLFTNDEYIGICKAPMYVSLEQSIHSQTVPSQIHALAAPSPYSISKYGSGSLHIKSCNEPYLWRKITFPTLLAVGLLMIIIIIVSYTLTCHCMYKSRERLYLSCCFKV